MLPGIVARPVAGSASSVICILLHCDLPTRAQNKLRYNLEMGIWRAKYRKAVEERDYATMEDLDRDYERVGLL